MGTEVLVTVMPRVEDGAQTIMKQSVTIDPNMMPGCQPDVNQRIKAVFFSFSEEVQILLLFASNNLGLAR